MLRKLNKGSRSQFNLSQINNDCTVKVNNTLLERVLNHKSLGVQIVMNI